MPYFGHKLSFIWWLLKEPFVCPIHPDELETRGTTTSLDDFGNHFL